MQGRGDGSHVWFDPIGLLVRPGQTVRWTNREAGNVAHATAYHPATSTVRSASRGLPFRGTPTI